MVEGFTLDFKTHKPMFHFQKLNYHSLHSISKLTKQVIIIFQKMNSFIEFLNDLIFHYLL